MPRLVKSPGGGWARRRKRPKAWVQQMTKVWKQIREAAQGQVLMLWGVWEWRPQFDSDQESPWWNMDPTLSYRSSAAVFPGRHPCSRIENSKTTLSHMVLSPEGDSASGKRSRKSGSPSVPLGGLCQMVSILGKKWESQHKRGKDQRMGLIFLTPVPGYCWVFWHNLKLTLCVFHHLVKEHVMPEKNESVSVWAKLHNPGNRAEDLKAQLLISQSFWSYLSLPFHCTSLNHPSMTIVMCWGEFLAKLYFSSFFFLSVINYFLKVYICPAQVKMQQKKKG